MSSLGNCFKLLALSFFVNDIHNVTEPRTPHLAAIVIIERGDGEQVVTDNSQEGAPPQDFIEQLLVQHASTILRILYSLSV